MSRKGLTEGLREFIIKVDHERAFEVGYLSRGMGKILKIRRPKVPEGYPDVTVRESLDELTLRAEEVYIEDIHQCQPHRRREVGPLSLGSH